jgi:hypothetical protein
MPLVNIAAAHTRSQVVGATSSPVNSIGLGTNSAAEDLTITEMGAGTSPGDQTTWKNTLTGATLSDSSSSDDNDTTDPFWQLEATWDDTEFNGKTIFEIGTAWGSLDGENPGSENNKLNSRKRVGGGVGLGKTADYSIIARVKMTYPSS